MIEDRLDYGQQDLVQMVLNHQGLDDDDLLARVAYILTESHTEGTNRDLATALFAALGISPRKNSPRGRPRKRTAAK